MVLEDAAVLPRCVAESSDVPGAFRAYQSARLPRTSHIQKVSIDNNWLRTGANADWVYGYDAWTVPLDSI